MASRAHTLLTRIRNICDLEERSVMKVTVIRDLVNRHLDPAYAELEDRIEKAMGEDDYWDLKVNEMALLDASLLEHFEEEIEEDNYDDAED